MRIEQLEYLLTINNCNSISQAAEILHISQQAISVAVKQLESELDTTLLERTTKGSYLTAAGQEVVLFASKFFNEWDMLSHKIRTFNLNEKNSISLYLQPNLKTDTFLAEIISILYNNIPQLQLDIKYESTENIIHHIQSNPNAIGFFNIHEKNLHKIPKCHQIIFNTLYLALWGNKESAIIKHKSFSLSQLTKCTLFTFNSKDEPDTLLNDIVQQYHLDQNNTITYNVPNYVSKKIIEKNAGIFIEYMSEKHILENRSNIGARIVPKENLKAYQIGITQSTYLYNILKSIFIR